MHVRGAGMPHPVNRQGGGKLKDVELGGHVSTPSYVKCSVVVVIDW